MIGRNLGGCFLLAVSIAALVWAALKIPGQDVPVRSAGTPTTEQVLADLNQRAGELDALQKKIKPTTRLVVVRSSEPVMFIVPAGNRWWFAAGEPPAKVLRGEGFRDLGGNCVLPFETEPPTREVRFQIIFVPTMKPQSCGF